jgi:hypothetical protein
MLPGKAHDNIVKALLRMGDLVGAFSESTAPICATPAGRLLTQYALLLMAITLLSWCLGIPILSHLERYLPRLAASPLPIMILFYIYKRFLENRNRDRAP